MHRYIQSLATKAVRPAGCGTPRSTSGRERREIASWGASLTLPARVFATSEVSLLMVTEKLAFSLFFVSSDVLRSEDEGLPVPRRPRGAPSGALSSRRRRRRCSRRRRRCRRSPRRPGARPRCRRGSPRTSGRRRRRDRRPCRSSRSRRSSGGTRPASRRRRARSRPPLWNCAARRPACADRRRRRAAICCDQVSIQPWICGTFHCASIAAIASTYFARDAGSFITASQRGRRSAAGWARPLPPVDRVLVGGRQVEQGQPVEASSRCRWGGTRTPSRPCRRCRSCGCRRSSRRRC